MHWYVILWFLLLIALLPFSIAVFKRVIFMFSIVALYFLLKRSNATKKVIQDQINGMKSIFDTLRRYDNDNDV